MRLQVGFVVSGFTSDIDHRFFGGTLHENLLANRLFQSTAYGGG